mmetsp:Transcript_12368/g.26177  ORF Transcript_12368/g.26177 Transcript_12368/m.26177 type:complete len:124 (-) Transcript_12368:1617-1988(-)
MFDYCKNTKFSFGIHFTTKNKINAVLYLQQSSLNFDASSTCRQIYNLLSNAYDFFTFSSACWCERSPHPNKTFLVAPRAGKPHILLSNHESNDLTLADLNRPRSSESFSFSLPNRSVLVRSCD